MINDFLATAIAPLTWMRWNALCSALLFAVMLWRADYTLRWHGSGISGASITIGTRIGLFLTLVGCVGNIADWWLGLSHQPSEIMINGGFLFYLCSVIASRVVAEPSLRNVAR